jgi:hypothetical protein
MGLFAVKLMATMFNDSVLVTTVTIIVSYLVIFKFLK